LTSTRFFIAAVWRWTLAHQTGCQRMVRFRSSQGRHGTPSRP